MTSSKTAARTSTVVRSVDHPPRARTRCATSPCVASDRNCSTWAGMPRSVHWLQPCTDQSKRWMSPPATTWMAPWSMNAFSRSSSGSVGARWKGKSLSACRWTARTETRRAGMPPSKRSDRWPVPKLPISLRSTRVCPRSARSSVIETAPPMVDTALGRSLGPRSRVTWSARWAGRRPRSACPIMGLEMGSPFQRTAVCWADPPRTEAVESAPGSVDRTAMPPSMNRRSVRRAPARLRISSADQVVVAGSRSLEVRWPTTCTSGTRMVSASVCAMAGAAISVNRKRTVVRIVVIRPRDERCPHRAERAGRTGPAVGNDAGRSFIRGRFGYVVVAGLLARPSPPAFPVCSDQWLVGRRCAGTHSSGDCSGIAPDSLEVSTCSFEVLLRRRSSL